jgi:hypothetical protein
MTNATIAFTELAEKGADADFVREILPGPATASAARSASTAAMATGSGPTKPVPARSI